MLACERRPLRGGLGRRPRPSSLSDDCCLARVPEVSGGAGTIRRHGAHLRRGVGPGLRHTPRPGRRPLPRRGLGRPDASRRDDWAPIEGGDDGVDRIAFVDGVRRIDARLTLDDPGARADARPRAARSRSGRSCGTATARRSEVTRRAHRAVGGARRRKRRADAAGRPRAGRRHHHGRRATTRPC